MPMCTILVQALLYQCSEGWIKLSPCPAGWNNDPRKNASKLPGISQYFEMQATDNISHLGVCSISDLFGLI